MPVLARTLEAAGLATILVSMMPYWSEKVGTPRTLAVEFPFGQTLGQANNTAQQMRVIEEALGVLEGVYPREGGGAVSPATLIHSAEIWPIPQKEAYKQWQPAEPSPIIKTLAPQFRTMMRQNRKK